MRQEAVQQALAAMQNRPKPSLPMPSKRTSVMAKSPDRERHDSGGYCQYLMVAHGRGLQEPYGSTWTWPSGHRLYSPLAHTASVLVLSFIPSRTQWDAFFGHFWTVSIILNQCIITKLIILY